MYRPGKNAYGPPQFGSPPPLFPPFRARGPCGDSPPGRFLSGPCGPFVAPGPNSHLHYRPPGGHFASPHCSSDHSTPKCLGSSQQMIYPVEPPPPQVPQWNPSPVEHHRPDNSEQAGEEFLRCIADNKPLPDYLKGNMAYNLADAIRTANALKEAVKSDLEFQKHLTKHKSHSRSRSHGRSRGKSCAKSPVRSKSRTRSQSTGRHRSRTRGRSHAKSKSRACSRSHGHSRSKSYVRSTSQVRRSRSRSDSSDRSPVKLKKRKISSSPNCSTDAGRSSNLQCSSLLEGLKLVMNSRELEEQLPSLKEAILSIQASCESQEVACAPDQSRQPESLDISTPKENDSTLLPHDRIGSDFSWLQVNSQDNITMQKADVLEDEESFLYGSQHTGENEANKFSAPLSGQHAHRQYYQSKPGLDQNLHELKQQPQATSSDLVSANLDSSEYEKIKEILKSVGTSDISQVLVKVQGQSLTGFGSVPATQFTVPPPSSPNVCQALQCIIKATKDKQERNVSGSSQTSDKRKADDNAERRQRKQAIVYEMESLLKELEGLLKRDEMSFLTPVLGLYCQKCEEFFGDLNCAENHAAIHRHYTSNSKVDKLAADRKGHSHYTSSHQKSHLGKGDHKAFFAHSGNPPDNRDDQQDSRKERQPRSTHSDDLSCHSATQESISLRKDRMLITVSQGLTPLNVRVKYEENKEKATGSHGTVKVEKSSEGSTHKANSESSDSSDRDTGKSPKDNSLKKKKKKRKKKKKKKKRDNP